MLRATGDRIMYSPTGHATQSYDADLFPQCSQNAETCYQRLLSVSQGTSQGTTTTTEDESKDESENESKDEAPPFHQIIYFNDETMRKTYRKGQGTMRHALIQEFERTCPASLCSEIDMLDAAHIVPYSKCNHCDSSNGLLLHTAVHRAMDRGKIIYNGNGKLWRHPGPDGKITDQWLHDNASIRNNQLHDDLLTDLRKKWLKEAYGEWLNNFKYKEGDLREVKVEF